jgi:hypothetical protein
MAEGIITTSDAEFRGILEGRPADVAAIALAARPELRRLLEAAIRHRVPPPPAQVTVQS